MGVLDSMVTGLSSHTGNKIQTLTPMQGLSDVNGLPETKRIRHLAKLPGLAGCNEARALQYKEKLTLDQARLYFLREMAEHQKGRMDVAVEATGVRLNVRQHGMKAAVQIAGKAANHRIAGIQAGYMLNEAKTVATAWEKAANQSASMINF